MSSYKRGEVGEGLELEVGCEGFAAFGVAVAVGCPAGEEVGVFCEENVGLGVAYDESL